MIYPKLHSHLVEEKGLYSDITPGKLCYVAGKTGGVGKGVAELRAQSVSLVMRPGQSHNQVTRSKHCHRGCLSRCCDAAGTQGWLRIG